MAIVFMDAFCPYFLPVADIYINFRLVIVRDSLFLILRCFRERNDLVFVVLHVCS